MTEIKNLVGEIFGKLTVLEFVKTKHKNSGNRIRSG